MELRHLRYFVAVAEERSITRAAERLWIAQPGLSTQIRRLERELGVELLRRHARGVETTPVGELFLERARAALAAVDAVRSIGSDRESGVVGTVRLGLSSGARWQPTAELLRSFNRECGGVELTLLEGHGGMLWRYLRDCQLDGLLAPHGHASPDLSCIELGAEPWTVLIGRGHRLAGLGPLIAADLDGERIALSGHRDGAVLDRTVIELLDCLDVEPRFVVAPSGVALHAAVAANECVALTTAPDPLPSGVLARRLDPSRTLRFELLRRDEAPSPALARFIGMAQAVGSVPRSTDSLPVAGDRPALAASIVVSAG